MSQISPPSKRYKLDIRMKRLIFEPLKLDESNDNEKYIAQTIL